MAYLTIDDLTTHIYPEIILEITRETVKQYANLAAFPATGIKKYFYKDMATSKYYLWDGDSYVETTYIDRVRKAINAGVGEAKSFLTRYDTVKMFSDVTEERTFQDDMLDSKVKDLVVFHLIKLCNVQTNYELCEANYNHSIKYFEKVQKGIVDPQWPLKPNNPDTPNEDSGQVDFRSDKKRRNNY